MKLILGDSLQKLKDLPSSTIDAIVTDPPWALKFMNKRWDYELPSKELWEEVFRVLKPGAHALVCCGTRTQHRMVVNIEDAGFEIRDVVTHLYGSGFPKSHNLDGEWKGYGTALKPACEFWTLARKPLEKGLTVAENVLKWGTGAINVDACRIGVSASDPNIRVNETKGRGYQSEYVGGKVETIDSSHHGPPAQGRWPANVLFDEEAAAVLDEQSGVCRSSMTASKTQKKYAAGDTSLFHGQASTSYSDSGGASRFFYVAKTSKRERNAGIEKTDFIWDNSAWENEDLKSTLQDALQLVKDISGGTLMAVNKWSTDGYGSGHSALCHQGLTYTIRTASRLITDLKTWSASPSWSIRESIQAAIETIEANGLSLVESVNYINQLPLTFINEETEYLRGVVRVLLKMLLKIKESAAKNSNFHSTVKPIKLMEYLCKLITPPGGVILDPFMGSGSTGCAAVKLGYQFIGIERETEYIEIAKRRIEHWQKEQSQLKLHTS